MAISSNSKHQVAVIVGTAAIALYFTGEMYHIPCFVLLRLDLAYISDSNTGSRNLEGEKKILNTNYSVSLIDLFYRNTQNLGFEKDI